MKQYLLFLSLLLFGVFFQGCKDETPNVAPLISIKNPDYQLGYKLHQHIPVSYSVYDEDGLSSVSWALTLGQNKVLLDSGTFTGISDKSFSKEYSFRMDTLYGSRDSIVCFYTVRAEDVTGLSQSVSVLFSVK